MGHIKAAIVLFLILGIACLFGLRASAPAKDLRNADAETIIRQAGNTEDETERYRLLKELSERKDLKPALRADLEKLLPVIDDWANGREKAARLVSEGKAAPGYLVEFFDQPVRSGGDYPPKISGDSPLYPIWCYYRGRMLVWVPIGSGVILRDDKLRESYHGEARRLLKVAADAFPDNRIIGMYMGQAIRWPADFKMDPNAPEWANLQREGLEKLRDIIHWWIDNRQLEDGQFGGWWGDDCEMWRWWTPLLVGFEDPKIAAAQENLSSGLLSLGRMRGGYTSWLLDVEHTAEDTADTITPMMHLRPDERLWQLRALRLAHLMRQRWTGRNERGFLQFRSTYFSVDRVDDTPQYACDTPYHARAMQPTLLLWQRTADEELGKLFSDWMATWVDAVAREERGKPAGILPTAIHWPDGRVGGLGNAWWKPENYPDGDIYNWPAGLEMITDTLLLTYHMTGDKKYLEPIKSMARIRSEYLSKPVEESPAPGTAAWCAGTGGKFGNGMANFLPRTLAKYRLLTGDEQFDHLLRADAGGYMKFRLTGDRAALVEQLKTCVEAFRVNKPGFTGEVRYTDRVLMFTERWFNLVAKEPVATPDVGVLYAMVTGDPGNPLYFPMDAVRWLTEPRDIAVLVTDSGTKRFEAELYHFGDEPRKMGAELHLLESGQYAMGLREVDGDVLSTRVVNVTGPRTRIEFELPPRKLCRLVVSPLKSTHPIR